MGYMRHHAIVVTSFDDYGIGLALAKARELGLGPVGPIASANNNEPSIFIPPDGSKEGWAQSNAGDIRRAAFVEWLRNEDTYCQWVEVSFGHEWPAYVEACSGEDPQPMSGMSARERSHIATAAAATADPPCAECGVVNGHFGSCLARGESQ